jgi:hypothetical protein
MPAASSAAQRNTPGFSQIAAADKPQHDAAHHRAGPAPSTAHAFLALHEPRKISNVLKMASAAKAAIAERWE